MDERERRVYALLRTLNAWVPEPKRQLASKPGFASDRSRYITCPDCLTNDRVMVGCETCGGRGEIPDPGPDPYREKVKGFYADDERERRREASHRRDRLLEQLAQEERVRAGVEAAADEHTAIVEAAARHRRRGSYAELERALDGLRGSNEGAYRTALAVSYDGPELWPVEPPDSLQLRAAVSLLAERMPESIRVPLGVPVRSRHELLEEAERLRERATWRGRRDPLARARRDDVIRRLAVVEGLSAVEVAARVGVHRRTVERLLNADGAPEGAPSTSDREAA